MSKVDKKGVNCKIHQILFFLSNNQKLKILIQILASANTWMLENVKKVYRHAQSLSKQAMSCS